MKKIMIIEDDTIISKELYELLVNAGYEALILKDFSNAKEEILKSNIDLILLDINIILLELSIYKYLSVL